MGLRKCNTTITIVLPPRHVTVTGFSYTLIYVVRVDRINEFVATDEISDCPMLEPSEFIECYKGNDKEFLMSIIKTTLVLLQNQKSGMI